jgi:hypothetical protein
MRLPQQLRGAAGMTFVAYAFRTASALLLVWPALMDFVRILAAHVYRSQLAPADLAPLLELASRNARPYALWSAATLAGYALLTPLVSLAWLHALARPQTVVAAFARATTDYVSALLLAALALLATALTLTLALLSFHPAVAGLLPATPAAESLATLFTLALAALALLLVATAHDLAGATLAHTRSLRASLRAVRAAGPRPLTQHALLALGAAAVAVLADAVARAFPTLPHALLVPSQQALLFCATLLRGCWLALAVTGTASAPLSRRRS